MTSHEALFRIFFNLTSAARVSFLSLDPAAAHDSGMLCVVANAWLRHLDSSVRGVSGPPAKLLGLSTAPFVSCDEGHSFIIATTHAMSSSDARCSCIWQRS